mgnify:CR=1 FL=1
MTGVERFLSENKTLIALRLSFGSNSFNTKS